MRAPSARRGPRSPRFGQLRLRPGCGWRSLAAGARAETRCRCPPRTRRSGFLSAGGQPGKGALGPRNSLGLENQHFGPEESLSVAMSWFFSFPTAGSSWVSISRPGGGTSLQPGAALIPWNGGKPGLVPQKDGLFAQLGSGESGDRGGFRVLHQPVPGDLALPSSNLRGAQARLTLWISPELSILPLSEA